MTTTPPLVPAPIVTTGLEYSIKPSGLIITPPGELPPEPEEISTWAIVTFDDLPNSIVLNGFRAGARYYVKTCSAVTNPDGTPTIDPDTGEVVFSCTTTYPSWELVEQTLVVSSPTRQVFSTDNGTELFTAEPGTYGGVEYTSGGITDGTEYEYARVFDKSNISYWPRASTPKQKLIENPTTMPSGDDQYLIDTLTSFIPDSRESVTITYTLTTTYRHFPWNGLFPSDEMVTVTDTKTFTQIVKQEIDDVADKIEAYLKRSYYSDGKYHIQLHDMDEPDLYDEGGELIAPDRFKVPVYQETAEGYQKLMNSVTPITIEDILKETLDTSVEELENLINIMDTYEFPE